MSHLPDEPKYPFIMSTRDFLVLYCVEGHKPSELIKKFPNITVKEIKHHQAVIRETRLALRNIMETEP